MFRQGVAVFQRPDRLHQVRRSDARWAASAWKTLVLGPS
jgi:hypothetical protein